MGFLELVEAVAMRGLVVGTMAALTFASALPAQEPAPRRASSPPPAPAPARPRVGYAGTPTPAPQPAQVQIIQPTYYYTPDGSLVSGGQYLVLTDGSVLANFGNGYERVLRACGQTNNVNAAEAQRNATGRDALGRILPPPGIAALQAGSRGQMGGTAPARNAQACYRHDGRGRAEVVTTGR
ncbi:MAG: hypothetical protein ABI664_14850 [bacterium]